MPTDRVRPLRRLRRSGAETHRACRAARRRRAHGVARV